jgi:hypothetical protein
MVLDAKAYPVVYLVFFQLSDFWLLVTDRDQSSIETWKVAPSLGA